MASLQAARSRATTTDIDRSALPLDLAPMVREDPAPPVLHLVWAPGEVFHDFPDVDVRALLAGARSHAGIDPEVASIWMDPSDWISPSFPRGLSWGAYPIVGEPRHRIWRDMPLPSIRFAHEPRRAGRTYSQAEVAGSAGTAVIHVPPDVASVRFELRSRALGWVCEALEVARALVPGRSLLAVEPDGSTSAGARRLEALVEGHRPWARFHYAYAANFYAIAAKALERSLDVVDPGTANFLDSSSIGFYVSSQSNAAVARRVRARLGIERLADPIALQLLYDLRRRGGVLVGGSLRNDSWTLEAFAADESGEPAWSGTGRYAPRPLRRDEATSVVQALARHHMLRLDSSKLVTSATAEAFLDMLHPDCEDPDMPLRWARDALGAAEREAMDAWIGRTFRKMKVRVNALG